MHEIWSFGQKLLETSDPKRMQEAFLADFEHVYYTGKGTHYKDVLRHLLQNSDPDNWFRCNLNGTDCWLPRDSLMMMRHCVFDRLEESILIMIEGRHTEWMKNRLNPRGMYVDIGAFSGAMVLPFAIANPKMKVHAFEPARTANARLGKSIAKNGLSNVVLHEVAVSDERGEVVFSEIADIHDHVNAPEGSSIKHGNAQFSINTSPTQSYKVETDTIDRLLFDEMMTSIGGGSVFKIDVEGFEMNVLRGASRFIERFKPALSIDIHLDPFGPGETEPSVRAFLSPLGYGFQRLDHVLVCDTLAK